MHISIQSTLFTVVTARSKFISFLLLFFIKKSLCTFPVVIFFLHITALEAGLGLVYAFQSRWN